MAWYKNPIFWFKFSLFISVGCILNVLTLGYLSVVVPSLKFYGPEGLIQTTLFFIKDVGHALSVLLFGEVGNNPAFRDAHRFFTKPLFQTVFWGIYALLFYRILRVNNKEPSKKEAHEYGSHGTARWMSRKEIIQYYLHNKPGFVLGSYEWPTWIRKIFHERWDTICHTLNAIKGLGDRLDRFVKKYWPYIFLNECIHSLDDRLNNIIAVIGASNAGKSVSIAAPNILHTAEKTGRSMIITDPKGELYNWTADRLRQQGYDVYIFNLLDTKKSHRYNPLDHVTTTLEAQRLSATIIRSTSTQNEKGGDPFFENAEQNLLTSLILYVCEQRPKEERHLGSVLEVGMCLGDNEEAFDRLFDDLPQTSKARKAYRIFKQGSDKTKGNVLQGFGVRLQLWVDDEIIKLTSASDFQITDFGKKKTAIFLLFPVVEGTFDVLPALFIDQTFRLLYDVADQNGGTLPIPMFLILDELGNIAPIAELSRKIQTMRGKGFSAVLMFQDLEQFEKVYGTKNAHGILGSCNTQILLGTTGNLHTRKHFSELLDDTTWTIETNSENKNQNGESSGRSESHIQRRLMTPGEIGNMSFDELLLIQAGRHPARLKKNYLPRSMQVPIKPWQDITDRQDKEVAITELDLPKAQLQKLERPSKFRRRPPTRVVKVKEPTSTQQQEKPKKRLFSKKK